MASQRTTVIAVVALVAALALPVYFVVIKKRAAASLEDLMTERFKTPRACPLAQVDVASGGHITCQSAYEDGEQAGTLLLFGSWARGTVKIPGGVADVDNKVAGVYKPSTEWLAHVRADNNVIAAIEAPGGALAFWSGLPDRASVLAHLEAVK